MIRTAPPDGHPRALHAGHAWRGRIAASAAGHRKFLPKQTNGELAERSNAAVLKTVSPQGLGGSNPSLSARKKKTRFGRVFIAFPELCFVRYLFVWLLFNRMVRCGGSQKVATRLDSSRGARLESRKVALRQVRKKTPAIRRGFCR